MRGLVWIVVIGMSASLVGCDLLSSSADDVPVEQPAETAAQQVEAQLEAVERLRGRAMPEELAVAAGDPSTIEGDAMPESVRQEWQWFEHFLFGGGELNPQTDQGDWKQLAAVDDTRGQLVFLDTSEAPDVDRALAVSMAANQVLEERLLGPLPQAETVDEWLSREIIRRAGPTFVSAMVQAQQHDVPLSVDDLADRPELATHIPGFGDRLSVMEREDSSGSQMEPPDRDEFLDEALQQLVLRKGLSVGATLYRAGGWPGVEWGRSEPPKMTQYLVHPRRWFDGAGQSTWDWPEAFEAQREEQGFEQTRQGSVGPALTSLWLEGLVGARAARTIYSGWRADSYRIYERQEGEAAESAFHWVSAWETPHDAQEIASAVEAVLGHYTGHEHREKRFRVAVQGLNVAVSIHDIDQPLDGLNREVEVLTEARVGYLPEDRAPFSYVPTLYDRYDTSARESTLDLEREEWIDEAAGWRVDLEALEGWTVQRSNETHVRWFANHSDGTMIQWTTELVDPLDSEFGSEDYLQDLSEAFARSVSAMEPPEIAVIDSPAETTIAMEVLGLIDGRPLVLQLWQWRRGDVLVSFSIQGPEAFFGDRLSEAEAILSSASPYGEAIERREAKPEGDPDDDAGIIEFRVDE